MKKENTCPRCNVVFHCGSGQAEGKCWCAALPRIMPVDAEGECLCPDCLRVEIDRRTAERAAKTEDG